jgi:hypothetical protein
MQSNTNYIARYKRWASRTTPYMLRMVDGIQ